MSGSAALEYGFPSTHSTNAVSVAVYALALLNLPDSTLSPAVNVFLQGITYLYVTSIVFGRLYCGMHGFFDVVIGCLLGSLLAVIQYAYGTAFDEFVVSASGKQIMLVVLVILALIRLHPEPADDCPCFDDSVAFAGVILGLQVAYWHVVKTDITWDDPVPATVPYRFEDLGVLKTAMRLILGVALIVVWREVMKPSLLRLHEYETMMGTGNPRLATGVDGAEAPPLTEPFPDLVLDPEPDEEEMFARIKRPRVRYDVEVVTKLVVYSGMWFFSFLFLPISDHD
ncbi:unnamed protein product [Aspergillus oryzae var. brunneus]|uniref:Unnamed protein product n=2 Tax=Aspergillus oryzae TaxID=5062 RepID=A0AAN4YHW8_ASPOZ|nr:unnamed protein product [Aspergillus oryzae]GMG27086.1 unnamed protein product [Aspergillus oryzae]GMG52584.1 unnamed protein product [Aspergillus oryzae var. brunneus]